MADIEAAFAADKQATTCSDGYPAIASFIARDPDHESFVFRRFNRLTARKLLHMQSELLELEQKLMDLDEEAANSNDHVLHSSLRRWEDFERNAQTREQEKIRKDLAEMIELKLDRYHKALLLQSQVARLERPPQRVLSAYKEALHGAHGDDPKLGGKARYMLDDDADLLILNPPSDNDALSRFLRNHWVFKTQVPLAEQDSRTRHFEERSLTWLVSICSTTIAATLLIGSILALYFVTSPDARLGIVLAFIVLFALGLSTTTHASRDAIFAATAAYAAVLIVYISGSPNSVQPG
ncbi:hypothetical protein LTR85_007661 [Meristemomyces frigidus]|nr:hypothetical protein LTR85_007661 [Meristemomyces frigidus]